MNHILVYCVLNKVIRTSTETTTQHYATLWSISFCTVMHWNN